MLSTPGQTPRQAEQEGRHFFLRGLATEQKHLVLRSLELVRRHCEQPLLQLGKLLQQELDLAARELAKRDRGHRLGGVRVAVMHRQAEEISREEETGDLPSPVRQKLVQLHRSRGHVVDAVRLVAFAEQGLLRIQILGAHDIGHARQFRLLQRCTYGQLAYRTRATRIHADTVGRFWGDTDRRHGRGSLGLLLNT